ncbi:DUF3107 domain-containing protein [Gardnerella sp. 2492-Sm]|uniref:DUF3107 domain-containing protein n=1 Tax=unclassified Gardnerella TaxID=2628112 RepID=UPI003CFE666C
MNVTLGINHSPEPLHFETESSAEEVQKAINEAIENNNVLTLNDVHKRKIVVPAASLAYAIVGDKPTLTVGFGV